MKDYELTLATLDVSPAAVAQITVKADSLAEAHEKALAADFDELDWTYDNGQSVPWDNLGSNDVTVAE